MRTWLAVASLSSLAQTGPPLKGAHSQHPRISLCLFTGDSGENPGRLRDSPQAASLRPGPHPATWDNRAAGAADQSSDRWADIDSSFCEVQKGFNSRQLSRTGLILHFKRQDKCSKRVNNRAKPGCWRHESVPGNQRRERALPGTWVGGLPGGGEPWRMHSSHRWEGGLGTLRGQCQQQKRRGVEDISGYPGVGVCSHWGRPLDP